MLWLGLRLIRSLPLAHPSCFRLCRSTPIGSIPAGNVFHEFARLRLFSNVRALGLRLIDSNFPVLGLRPPLCCVYVAACPARSLPLAHPHGLRLCRSTPVDSIPAGNVYLANLQWIGKSQNEISTGAGLRSSPAQRRRGFDLMSDTLPFRLWYAEPNAVNNAVGYAEHRSRSHHAVIRVVMTLAT